MSPEQATDQPLDGRSDLYSLGCVAYWMLTGQQVFSSESPMELLTDHVQTAPVAPSKRIGKPIPAPLEDLVMSCLAKDPAKRPGNARVLAFLLSKIRLDQAWDEEQMKAWWDRHLPARPLPVGDAGVPQVFSPRRVGR
jgi:serine/threonine-protein kinase